MTRIDALKFLSQMMDEVPEDPAWEYLMERSGVTPEMPKEDFEDFPQYPGILDVYEALDVSPTELKELDPSLNIHIHAEFEKRWNEKRSNLPGSPLVTDPPSQEGVCSDEDEAEVLMFDLSLGNRGAVSVLSLVYLHYGMTGLKQIESVSGLRGSKIWCAFKDDCGQNLDLFMGVTGAPDEADELEARLLNECGVKVERPGGQS